MTKCRQAICTNEATTTLSAEDLGVVWDTVELCAACKKRILDGWDKMQADAQCERDKGLSKNELSKIMCERVTRGDYK